MPTPEPKPTTPPLSPEAQAALTYLAEQEKIPTDQLVVTSEEFRDFPLLGRRFVLVTILHDQADAPQSYRVLVDPTSKAVEPDFDGVLLAEQAATQDKYGKFDLPLYDKLQASEENEAIPIVIWAAETGEEDAVKAAEHEVAELYPEAAKALAERGVAWSVDDEALRLEIKRKFAELLAARSAKRTEPIVAWLEEKGYSVEKVEGSPIVAATLRKQDILALAELTFVAQIQLGGGQAAPSSNISVPTSRVPAVWSRGMSGSGVRLAIVEADKINNTARNCLNVIATLDNTLPDSLHKSAVSAIASCNDATKRGVAYNAQILDAGYSASGTMVTAATALNWAVTQNLADVTNQSERFTGQQLDTNLYYLDMFYDYLVKAYDFTAVIAAGNKDPDPTKGTINVGTPAKGWNVITVGNSEDQNTASWADDKINESAIGSSYENPSSGVEKPEVAAPGTNIDTVAGQLTGTSLSAPHVAGLAALLMQRKNVLKDYPSAVKAIIMASAVENTEGDKRLSGKDGAGAIDAALADWIAQTEGGAGTCSSPCWWNIPIDDNNLPEPNQNQPSNYLYRTFNATRGERIRVVISWLSSAAADGTLDQLRTELNLHVRRP
ncbi:MAG: S8 family serine peptidase, partial [Caldilineaceae bacterium]|nr:S8 family serine peptidase [Caldilineaceae bacterium]